MTRLARKLLVGALSAVGKVFITFIALGFVARAGWEALRKDRRS